MTRTAFRMAPVKHQYALGEEEMGAYRITAPPDPVDWVEGNLALVSTGYVNPGPVRLLPWQRDILRAFTTWSVMLLLGPVQTGKSLLADLCAFYGLSVLNLSGMLVYGNEKQARKVFSRRIRPMIVHNECLAEHWSGKDDDLSVENIQLRNCFWGIASAQNRDDLATFPAGVIVGSEVSKWRKMTYHPVEELVGRQEAYASRGTWKRILETSPNERGDYMYHEVYRHGTLVLAPFQPCLLCGEYQILMDEQIKLRKTGDAEPDHDPARIRAQGESAAWYECRHCHQEIREIDRPRMMERTVWAAPAIEERVSEQYTFTQEPDTISKDGTVHGERRHATQACFWWNRLVSPSFTFAECLSRFFSARRNPERMKMYLNNDMARFHYPVVERLAKSYFESRVVQSDYEIGAEAVLVPSRALILTCGVDTQDNGFFYVVQAWGAFNESWVVGYGFIPCPVATEETGMQGYDQAFRVFAQGLFARAYRIRLPDPVSGQEREIEMLIARAFVDRGGHRAPLVDHVCGSLPGWDAYIGATRDDPKRSLVWPTEHGYYYGKTELISDLVGAHMRTRMFHLPRDTTDDFVSQIGRQYHYNVIDKAGNQIRRWHHGGDDHYRDALNLNYAVLLDLGLDVGLFEEATCQELRKGLWQQSDQALKVRQKLLGQEEGQTRESERRPRRPQGDRPGASYFGHGRY